MNTVFDIADQLRACIFEHVRTVIEPDDAAILVAYLESQGFLSKAARAAAVKGRRVHPRFLKFREISQEDFDALSESEQEAFQSDYSGWLETEPGLEAKFAAEPTIADEKAGRQAADNRSVSAGAVEIAKHTPGSGPQEPLTESQTRDAEAAKRVEVERPRTFAQAAAEAVTDSVFENSAGEKKVTKAQARGRRPFRK